LDAVKNMDYEKTALQQICKEKEAEKKKLQQQLKKSLTFLS